MRTLPVLMIAIASACAVAGGASDVRASPSPSWTPDPAHVFQARPGTPPGAESCRTESEVEAVLLQFAAAFNSGDRIAVEATLSPEFWALLIHGQVAYTRDDAIRFVLERQHVGDRIQFRSVQINGLVGWDGAAHIGPVDFVLRRDGSSTLVSGKGALYCGGTVRGIKVLGVGA